MDAVRSGTIAGFLAGTRIATDRGDIAVEQLRKGDQVVTIEGSERVLRTIQRLGRRDIDLTGFDEQAARDAAPVRIRAHAFAANIPMRDLLVAPEHGVFADGRLIAARMLVNGASIARDASLLRFSIYWLECDRHAILLANGLSTGSCFDEGQDDAASATHPRAAVEPIWRRLRARAEQLELVAPAAPQPAKLDQTGHDQTGHDQTGLDHTRRSQARRDPPLCLRLDDGTVLRARRRSGERHFFLLPAGTERAILLSRPAGAARTGGLFADDRRRRRLLVHSATLWMKLRSAAIPLAASWLQGWHPGERCGQQEWPDGEAEITFDAVSRETVLEVTLAGKA